MNNTLIKNCIENNTTKIPIWLMRQAGRYLPEFRSIRKKNEDFIKLCLNKKLSSEITLQPLDRFNFDAAILFSDILLVPYALGQKVKFMKNYGPELGKLDINILNNISKQEFISTLNPVYESLKLVEKKLSKKNKDIIGFVGAPWTLLVYMLNRKSPKENNFNSIPKNREVNILLEKVIEFLKIHIDAQIKNGATIIQIFDSWAGLLEEDDLEYFVYNPTQKLTNFIKEKSSTSICFPRNIKNYRKYVEKTKTDIISIDYNVDPNVIKHEIEIPIQGGLDPKILLEESKIVKKGVLKYLDAFKNNRYIFNLGHGVLPKTNPETVKYMVELVKDYK